MSWSFSALQRAEIAEITGLEQDGGIEPPVSVLFNEPKLLKLRIARGRGQSGPVSVLFNEPKLLKSTTRAPSHTPPPTFQCSSTSRNC